MAGKYMAYVGTYTRGESKGIYVLDMDPETAAFSLHETTSLHNPTYLVISANGKYLYSSCDEGIASFLIESDGTLTLINKASVNGLRPDWLTVDKENHYIVCGGYFDGKVTSVKLYEDGSIGDVADEIFMKGLGVVGGVHYRSHISCVLFTPDERYLLAVDIGCDQTRIFDFDHESGTFTLHDILRSDLESGPRIMTFAHSGQYAYLTHEYSNKIIKYSYDPDRAWFTKVQELSTTPANFINSNSTITVKTSSDDKHVFVTNSGDNSIATYNVLEDESMETSFILPVSGEFPIDIALMPGDERIVSVNQESDTITTFRINYENEYMLLKAKPFSIPSPTCIAYRKL